MSTERPPEGGPKSIPHAFADAWNRRDPDGIAALFVDDAEFVNVTGLWWYDHEAIRRAHAYGLEAGTSSPSSSGKVRTAGDTCQRTTPT